MEFRILGPLEVVEDGNPVALGMLKERLVLGVLLLHANEFVSRDRLIDDLWGEALSLWRGPTLAGLQLESRGRDEVAQLDELRLAALMDRIDCDLALGWHERALGELNVLVREHPLRERLRAQQMLALYRADRQADALEVYAEARQTLVDDLGIEPCEALQRLQQAILRHDPSLETPEGTAAVNGLPASSVAPPSPTPIADAGLGEGPTRRGFR